MMRSLFSGISGLKNHQTRMDVIGNNIANVNTIGFKRSRVLFQDMLNQTLQTAAAPTENSGGSNPKQIGLGMSLATIDVLHTMSSAQPTGKNTDLSIEGDGFFIVSDGSSTYYTRAGNFDLNSNNVFIQGGSGLIVQGIMADSAGVINVQNKTGDIKLKKPEEDLVFANPRATSLVSFAKNLDFRAEQIVVQLTREKDAEGTTIVELKPPFQDLKIEGLDSADYVVDYATGKVTITEPSEFSEDSYTITYVEPNYSMSLSIFDFKGDTHLINVFFTKDKMTPNTWQVRTTIDGEVPDNGGEGTLKFDRETGRLDTTVSNVANLKHGIVGTVELNMEFDFSNVTENAGAFTITNTGQNGYEAGYLEEVTVDSNGILNGSYSNGQTRALAQLTIATFSNPAGLTKIGNNLYIASNNSGEPDQGLPGISGRGAIMPETLEMSNVDLTQEFVDMIITQRGFQANSRVITTSDQILEELVNLRR